MAVDWEYYQGLEALVRERKLDAAVASIAARRQEIDASDVPIFLIEARAHQFKGDPGRAIAILAAKLGAGKRDFWTHYNLAGCYRDAGDLEKTFDHYRRAHALAGWSESAANRYRFTNDYFAPCIAPWTEWFATHIATRPIRCLEIGSWQGESAAWLLDKIVSRRGGSLTCIDTFEGSPEQAEVVRALDQSVEAYFDDNIRATGHGAMCRKLKGPSQRILPTLHGENFDFIYIDGAHEAKYAIQDAVLSWTLLADGGFLLFDDVPYRFPRAPHQDTARAVDFFVSVFADDIAVLERGRQLLLRRTAG